MIVKGFVKPEMNDSQERLFAMFQEEHGNDDFIHEPYRIDKVDIADDDAILIRTSRFIKLERQFSSMALVRHLQIMETFRMYGADDPYLEMEDDVRYREVLLTSVYRTAQDDPGWIKGEGQYDSDPSDLHTDWL